MPAALQRPRRLRADRSSDHFRDVGLRQSLDNGGAGPLRLGLSVAIGEAAPTLRLGVGQNEPLRPAEARVDLGIRRQVSRADSESNPYSITSASLSDAAAIGALAGRVSSRRRARRRTHALCSGAAMVVSTGPPSILIAQPWDSAVATAQRASARSREKVEREIPIRDAASTCSSPSTSASRNASRPSRGSTVSTKSDSGTP